MGRRIAGGQPEYKGAARAGRGRQLTRYFYAFACFFFIAAWLLMAVIVLENGMAVRRNTELLRENQRRLDALTERLDDIQRRGP